MESFVYVGFQYPHVAFILRFLQSLPNSKYNISSSAAKELALFDNPCKANLHRMQCLILAGSRLSRGGLDL